MCGSLPSTIESVCVLQTQGLARLGGRCTLGVKHGDRTRNDRFRCFYCSLSVPDGDLALGTETPAQCLCLCFFMLGQGGAGVRLPFLLLACSLPLSLQSSASPTHPVCAFSLAFFPPVFLFPFSFPHHTVKFSEQASLSDLILLDFVLTFLCWFKSPSVAFSSVVTPKESYMNAHQENNKNKQRFVLASPDLAFSSTLRREFHLPSV